MRTILLYYFLFIIESVSAQTVAQKLDKAWSIFSKDEQLRHAIVGFSVVDSKTGKPIFERNAQVGLAPASTQKIITSVAAFELLGKEYRFSTCFRLKKDIHRSGPFDLEIESSGDPSFGSRRFSSTTDSVIIKNFYAVFKKRFPVKFDGALLINDFKMGNALPPGFTWEDMGNYYGAGSRQLNWRENQYDVYFKSDSAINTQLVKVEPQQPQLEFRNFVTAQDYVKGDEIYIYCPPESKIAYLEGMMPINKKNFVVSGSMPNPALVLVEDLKKYNSALFPFSRIGIVKREHIFQYYDRAYYQYDTVYTHFSPPLDSLNFYFLKKSINLYGEAFVKAISNRSMDKPYKSTEDGVEKMKSFFTTKGIDSSSLKIIDGSGLSPQNRVTSDALVKVLQYARTRPWFSSFYNALPEYNGMKMKSGSIGGARAYAGYHKATSGKEYSFSIIVNNFDGSSAEIVRKMYKLLDVLK